MRNAWGKFNRPPVATKRGATGNPINGATVSAAKNAGAGQY